jgi:regulator of sirC expression with transglutaminase-like and TPR domain
VSAVANPRASFEAAMAGAADAIDLARVLLLIAAEEYPALDVDAYLGRLDDLADGVRPRLSGDEGPTGVLAAINGHLYRELGFRGNAEQYDDPRNSFLNEVLDRRTGIPIALSVVYMEVARRLGHRLAGVNLPRHFMLVWDGPTAAAAEPLLVDAFDGGRIMSPADVERRLSATAGRQIRLRPEHLARAEPRLIVRRVLNNLRGLYVAAKDHARALAIVELMAIALPSPDVVRDRGLLLFRLRRRDESEAELRRYLELSPWAPDRPAVEQHLDWLRRIRAEMS